MLKIVPSIVGPGLKRLFRSLEGGLVAVELSAEFPPAVVVDFDPLRIEISVRGFIVRLLDRFYGAMRPKARVAA